MSRKSPWTTRILGASVFLFLALFAGLVYYSLARPAPQPQPFLVMELTSGPVEIRLRPDLAAAQGAHGGGLATRRA